MVVPIAVGICHLHSLNIVCFVHLRNIIESGEIWDIYTCLILYVVVVLVILENDVVLLYKHFDTNTFF